MCLDCLTLVVTTYSSYTVLLKTPSAVYYKKLGKKYILKKSSTKSGELSKQLQQ